MKIHYISDSAIPSSSPNSVHVMRMCQAFAILGHSVILHGKNTTACFSNIKNPFNFYAVQKIFKLKIFPAKAFKGSGLLYNVYVTMAVLNSKADLIYTRSIIAAWFGLLVAKPIVYEMHEPFIGKGLRLKKMFQFIAEHKKLKKMIVISEALKIHLYENYKIKKDKIFVAHDGADPIIKTDPAINDIRFSVGYIGSLYPGKGMEILLPLSKRCGDVSFHIVGGDANQISVWKKQAGSAENIIFHGFKTQEELPAYISSFNLLIAPYSSIVKVSQKKGANNLALWMSPLKIFEYMSAGKPIVATDLPVIREILTHQVSALLCKSNDLNDWENAIRQLQSDEEYRQWLGKNAKACFDNQFTWLKRAKNILNSID